VADHFCWSDDTLLPDTFGYVSGYDVSPMVGGGFACWVRVRRGGMVDEYLPHHLVVVDITQLLAHGCEELVG
jgi:hypothetical protein